MEEVIYEVLQIIDDIKNYLNGHNIFIITQSKLGFNKLFEGFIIKDWINSITNCRKYMLQNEVIIVEYVKHYAKCWKDRNRIYHSSEKKKEVLTEWCNKVQEKYKSDNNF